MENKMTAVEWLLLNVIISGVPQSNSGLSIDDVRDQALQMEKEQIIESNYDGQSLHAKSVTSQMMRDNAEQYYNEIYGKD